jgi:hypothetical protein
MEYRVLGPLEVLDASGRKLRLGGAMQQGVLASLLLRGRHPNPSFLIQRKAPARTYETRLHW